MPFEFDQFLAQYDSDPATFVVYAEEYQSDGIRGIAIFRKRHLARKFTIGERKLFEIQVDAAMLYHQTYAGGLSQDFWQSIFADLAKLGRFSVIALGEQRLDSALSQAVGDVRWPWRTVGKFKKHAVHWRINLPGNFDDYLNLLRKSTKSSIKRKIGVVERDGRFRCEIFEQPGDIDRFLSDGESVSRRTYQWDVGHRLINDAATQDLYRDRAQRQQLRCYMLYLDDRPIAFLRGFIVGDTYFYETPGFLREFDKFSPGTVLLMMAIKDLIDNTGCEYFDFGEGGDISGYKSRFGTEPTQCRLLELARATSIAGCFVWFLSGGLDIVSLAARRLLGEGEVKRRLKRLIRRDHAG